MTKNLPAIFLAILPLPLSAASAPPNIILFYADDLGYTDLACQGSKFYETR